MPTTTGAMTHACRVLGFDRAKKEINRQLKSHQAALLTLQAAQAALKGSRVAAEQDMAAHHQKLQARLTAR